MMAQSNLFYLVFLTVFVCGCQKKEYIIHNDRVIEYNAPIDPLNFVASGLVKKQDHATYEQLTISWLNEHRFLEQNLNRGFLTAVESHRNIQNILTNIKLLLTKQKSRSINAYQKLYDNLLSHVKRKVSARVLLPRYQSLKSKIQQELF